MGGLIVYEGMARGTSNGSSIQSVKLLFPSCEMGTHHTTTYMHHAKHAQITK